MVFIWSERGPRIGLLPNSITQVRVEKFYIELLRCAAVIGQRDDDFWKFKTMQLTAKGLVRFLRSDDSVPLSKGGGPSKNFQAFLLGHFFAPRESSEFEATLERSLADRPATDREACWES